MKPFNRLFLVTGAVGLLLLGYNNCGAPPQKTTTETNQSSGSAPNPINFLKTPRPALIQGKDGYNYILTEYIRPQCGSCHQANSSNFIYIGADDLNTAYFAAMGYSKETFLKSVSNNRFCGKDCNLDPQGEVYKAIAEWLDNKF